MKSPAFRIIPKSTGVLPAKCTLSIKSKSMNCAKRLCSVIFNPKYTVYHWNITDTLVCTLHVSSISVLLM